MVKKYFKKKNLIYATTIAMLFSPASSLFNCQNIKAESRILNNQSNSNNDLDHFELNGSARLQNNTFTLTDDQNHQSGTAFLNTPIDFSKSIALDLLINIGNKKQQIGGGDGIAISFVPLKKISEIAKADGGALALGGIPNVFGFKIDTYFNRYGEIGKFDADPGQFGHIQGNGEAFGAFFESSENGVIKTLGQEATKITVPKVHVFQPLTFVYDKNTDVVNVTYDNQNWRYQLNRTQTFDQPMVLVISAATGHNHNLQQVIVRKTDFQPFTSKVTINYFDEKKNKLSPSTEVSGNINAQYVSQPKDIPGYQVISTPKNSVGLISETNEAVDYYYKPIKHDVVITYKYHNNVLRKDILSGSSDEKISYSPNLVLKVLKDYQVSHSEWLGEFLIPKNDTPIWYFEITLVKKPIVTVKEAPKITHNHGQPAKSKASVSHKQDIVKASNDPSMAQEQIKSVAKEVENDSKAAIEKSKNNKVSTTGFVSLNYVTSSHEQFIHHSVAQTLYSNNRDGDDVLFQKNIALKRTQPSPIDGNITNFTHVLVTLSAFTTFTNR